MFGEENEGIRKTRTYRHLSMSGGSITLGGFVAANATENIDNES